MSAAGSFPGMGFGSDMNPMQQMQMMMAMQSGMAPAAFSNFPMMGMCPQSQFWLCSNYLKGCRG
jgi:hypothetical protein